MGTAIYDFGDMQPVTVHGKAWAGSQARNGQNVEAGALLMRKFLLIWAGHSRMLVFGVVLSGVPELLS
jgi:hypothetical protein